VGVGVGHDADELVDQIPTGESGQLVAHVDLLGLLRPVRDREWVLLDRVGGFPERNGRDGEDGRRFTGLQQCGKDRISLDAALNAEEDPIGVGEAVVMPDEGLMSIRLASCSARSVALITCMCSDAKPTSPNMLGAPASYTGTNLRSSSRW
jgi:hypothetical protein